MILVDVPSRFVEFLPLNFPSTRNKILTLSRDVAYGPYTKRRCLQLSTLMSEAACLEPKSAELRSEGGKALPHALDQNPESPARLGAALPLQIYLLTGTPVWPKDRRPFPNGRFLLSHPCRAAPVVKREGSGQPRPSQSTCYRITVHQSYSA